MASRIFQDSNINNAGDFIGESAVTQSCEPCIRTNISKTATVFCKNCNEYLCDACTNPHTVYKTGMHDIVNFQDKKSAPVMIEMKGMDKCHEHGRDIEFFCQDHSKPCCSSCVFIHRKCDQLVEIAKVSGKKGPKLQALKQSLIFLKSEVDAIIADCKASETFLNESIAKMSSEVDKMRDRVIKLFEEAKEKLINKAKQLTTAEVKRIAYKRDASSRIKVELSKVLSMCCVVLESGTPSQQYIYSEIMKEKRKTIESNIYDQKRAIRFASAVTVSFPTELTSILEMGSNFMQLNYDGNKIVSGTHEGKGKIMNSLDSFISQRSDTKTLENKNFHKDSGTHEGKGKIMNSMERFISQRSEMKTLENKSFPKDSGTHEGEGKIMNPLDSLISQRSDMKTLENKNFHTEAIVAWLPTPSLSSQPSPITLKLLVSVDLPKTGGDKEEPFFTGLNFLPDGRVVAVDHFNRKCIILNERLQRLGSPYTFKSYPQCVVCVSDDALCVTCGKSKKVCLLSVSTDNKIRLVRKIRTSSAVASICCMSPSHLVVSTFEDPRPVRKISMRGVESDFDRVKFPQKTYKIGESKCTYVQSKNTLVLTDRYDHTVFMYDTVKGTSKTVTHKKIQEPRCACVGPGDTVLVCSRKTNCIVHLTIDGNILGIYPVNMEWPCSICVSKDGTRLAVSNNANGTRTLQLYEISPAMSKIQ